MKYIMESGPGKGRFSRARRPSARGRRAAWTAGERRAAPPVAAERPAGRAAGSSRGPVRAFTSPPDPAARPLHGAPGRGAGAASPCCPGIRAAPRCPSPSAYPPVPRCLPRCPSVPSRDACLQAPFIPAPRCHGLRSIIPTSGIHPPLRPMIPASGSIGSVP